MPGKLQIFMVQVRSQS